MMDRKIVFLVLILVFSLFVSFASAGVTRTISPSSVIIDHNITVTLTITLGAEDTIYAVDETIPTGFTVVDDGNGFLSGNNLRWVSIQEPAGSTIILTYVLTTPSTQGSSNISGIYQFDSMSASTPITGNTLITIINYSNPCIGQTNGLACTQGPITGYCCGQTCVAPPSSPAPTCQSVGTCCNGTSATYCNKASGTVCGTLTCEPSYCGDTGNNTLFIYPLFMNKTCDGLGICSILTSCTLSNTKVCGETKVCSAAIPECTSCTTGRANCDLNIANACEVNLYNDINNCGSCGIVCDSGNACNQGVCENPVCGEDPRRYAIDDFIVEIDKWKNGEIPIEEIILIARLYVYC